MIDYTYFFKEELVMSADWPHRWDLFLSGYNTSDRINTVFDKVESTKKVYVIHSEYGFSKRDLPSGALFYCENSTEYEFVIALFDQLIKDEVEAGRRICIDITGFMRPHLMFLVALMKARGVRYFDILYSEPSFYLQKEETQFHDGQVSGVRPVVGFEGLTNHNTTNDLVIIGAGYEDRLIKEVADQKEMARKIIVLGLPSLRADMYQQNALRTHLAADALGDVGSRKHFASASDPFVTATVLSQIVDAEQQFKSITNLYLSPLSTKAQALGFALFYVTERQGTYSSILFPEGLKYSRETSAGLSKVWLFSIEF